MGKRCSAVGAPHCLTCGIGRYEYISRLTTPMREFAISRHLSSRNKHRASGTETADKDGDFEVVGAVGLPSRRFNRLEGGVRRYELLRGTPKPELQPATLLLLVALGFVYYCCSLVSHTEALGSLARRAFACLTCSSHEIVSSSRRRRCRFCLTEHTQPVERVENTDSAH